MSLNEKLRRAVYGDARATQTNPLLHMPAGITGMTWQGTGFEQAPQEPVVLDGTVLPWELQEEPHTDGTSLPMVKKPWADGRTARNMLGVGLLLAIIVVALIVVGV